MFGIYIFCGWDVWKYEIYIYIYIIIVKVIPIQRLISSPDQVPYQDKGKDQDGEQDQDKQM